MNNYGVRGQMGEGIVTIYRLLMVTVVAFIVFSTASISYEHYIDVRDAEARILAREVSDCLSPDGVLNLDKIPEKDYENVLSYCGISQSERFYVGIEVVDSFEKSVAKMYQGDSGALWIKELFGKVAVKGNEVFDGNEKNVEIIKKFNPGYYKFEYPVFVLKDNKKFEGKIEMEVLINNEF
ncbi:MAG: hypothetical protein ABIF18_02265 [archaeon]